MARKSITVDVKQLVLHEAGYMCGNPACRMIITLDIHHLEYVSEGGANTAENLLVLCPTCHAQHHHGLIPRDSIRAWKFLLLALNEAYDRRSIDLLLTLDKVRMVRCSGDGLVNFASLIASQLVDCDGWGQATPIDLSKFAYHITLSAKGRVFVDAWKAGDQKAAIESLETQPKGEA